MQTVTDEFKKAIESDSRYFSTRCLFEGMEESITDDNIRNGVYTDIIDGNSVISMGNACSRKVEMTLGGVTQPFVWKGAKFTLEKGLSVNEEFEYVPWGTFWVTDMSTPNDGITISLTAYDRMYKLSKVPYRTTLTAPFHYRDLLDEFLTNAGMVLSEASRAKLPSAEDAAYIIESWPDGEFSYGDIAGHLAGMVGCNARVSVSDPSVLEFVWYEATGMVIENTLYQDGFEKLADSELCVNYFVTGNNKAIEIENTDGSTEGELDFRQFDSVDPADYPHLTFTYDDATLTASVRLTEGYESDTTGFGIPYSLFTNGNVYNVTSVEESGFEGCMATEIILPHTLESIGAYAFDGCTNLIELIIPERVSSIGVGVTIRTEKLTTLYYNAVNVTDGNANGLFENRYLENIIIGEGVTTIPAGFVRDSDLLTYVNIPDTVTTIEKYAFYQCDGLEVVTVPEGVTSIGHYAFGGCSSLKTVYYNAKEATGNTSGIFSNSAITTVVVGMNVLKLPEGAFRGCSLLKTINIPNTVQTIGGYSFFGCTSLEEVVISRSVHTIGKYAFSGCSALAEITFNEGINTIEANAFQNCRMVSVQLPNTIESIGSQAFVYCDNLVSVQIGTSANCRISSINTAAFLRCTGITDITIYAETDSVSGSPWGATNATVTWAR